MSNLDEDGMAFVRANADRINSYLRAADQYDDTGTAAPDALNALYMILGVNTQTAMAISTNRREDLPAPLQDIFREVENAFRDAGVATNVFELHFLTN